MNRDQEYDALKYKHDQAQRRLQRLEETVKLLEQQLKEKRDQIAVLERVSNVVLWEREKKRLLETCKYQQESLKTDLAQVREEYTTNKDNSKKTIQSLQEQIKKYELMIELELRQSKEDYLKELEKVRQELHVKRTMVARLEKEVTEQQKCFVGVLQGLRVDFRNLMQKFATEESKTLWKQLSTMFDTIYTSCASGNLSTLQASLPTYYIGLSSDIISSPLLLRKKGLKATSSSISLESLGHSSNTGDEDDDNDEVGIEDNNGRESSSSLPTLAAGANLTANTTNFIVEAKEKLQAHSQHMSHIFVNKTISETEFSNAPTTPPKYFTNRQGNNLMGEKIDSCQYGAMVSPLGRKRVTKTAWRSPKVNSHRLPTFTSSPPRSNFSSSSSSSLRNPAEAPVVTKSSPDGKRLSNRIPRSSMSQISLMIGYQDTTKEKTTPKQLQRKARAVEFSSLPLASKGRNQTQSTSGTKQFNSKANPCLVDKKNGILKISDVLVHFPHLTEEQVRSHFENFMKYDTNNDYTLDFNELRTAVTQVFSHGVVSKQELLDALEEVNADYSNSIEFYDYLVLSKKCLDLSGTSDLFHKQLVVQQHKKFADICCIQ